MSKVLITMLGTGALNRQADNDRKYKTAKYRFEADDHEYEYPFVAKALIEHLRIEKVIFIGTVKSMWEEAYREFIGEKIDEDYYFKLGTMIEKSDYRTEPNNFIDLETVEKAIDKFLNYTGTNGSKIILTKYGLNETEIRDNFNRVLTVSDNIEENDEIFIDITHSFRSLSLYIFTVINFIENMKKINIKGVYYGMLEVTKELEYTPIVNIDYIHYLGELIKGTYTFQNFGNGYLLADSLSKNHSDNNNVETQISRKLRNFSDILNLNYFGSIKEQLNSISRITSSTNLEFLDSSEKQIIQPIINNFSNKFKNIDNPALFQLELADWYSSNKKYSTAYITLTEAVITFACLDTQKDWKDYDSRKLAKDLFFNSENNNKLKQLFKKVRNYRNNIAHTTAQKTDFTNAINELPALIKNIREIITENN